MARKKAKAEDEAPATAAPASDRPTAMLGVDPTTVDTEERRRLGNQRRRFVRRRKYRLGRLDLVAEKDPAYHEELLQLRRDNPQAYRKALTRWCQKHGLYLHRRYTPRDQPAALMERYADSPGHDEDE